jgi:microcin C transport system permease protein
VKKRRNRRRRDPLLEKRLRRFRQKKRAVWSLWALVALFAISLCSELICNDRPLYVRFRGQSFFPALRYYPEDVFLGNGVQTRPHYRRLAGGAEFRDHPSNWMLFAPVPYGPYESIDPESIRAEEYVTVTLTREPHVAGLDVGPDGAIVRARAATHFFAVDADALPGTRLDQAWTVPPELTAAMRRRFRNLASPAIRVALTAAHDGTTQAEVALAAFTPRARPPRTVRLVFREPAFGDRAGRSVRYGPDMQPLDDMPAVWQELAPAQRESLLGMARACFSRAVYPERITIAARRYRVAIEKNDVAWPHPPLPGHWLGIDSAGRDVFARILYGLRISVFFGFLLVAVAILVGVAVGGIQGYYAGVIDITAQRVIEIWSAIPFLYVMILLGSVYGPSFALLVVCYGIFNWIGISYYVRAEFLRLRRLPFVESAKCMGIPSRTIIFRHVLPNALTPVITFFPFLLVGAIGSLAALDYLGFGLPPPTPSWGEMLHQAQQFRSAWWLILYPSLALFTVMLLGVFVGEGVRDAYDPKPFSRIQ